MEPNIKQPNYLNVYLSVCCLRSLSICHHVDITIAGIFPISIASLSIYLSIYLTLSLSSKVENTVIVCVSWILSLFVSVWLSISVLPALVSIFKLGVGEWSGDWSDRTHNGDCNFRETKEKSSIFHHIFQLKYSNDLSLPTSLPLSLPLILSICLHISMCFFKLSFISIPFLCLFAYACPSHSLTLPSLHDYLSLSNSFSFDCANSCRRYIPRCTIDLLLMNDFNCSAISKTYLLHLCASSCWTCRLLYSINTRNLDARSNRSISHLQNIAHQWKNSMNIIVTYVLRRTNSHILPKNARHLQLKLLKILSLLHRWSWNKVDFFRR